MTQLHAKNIWFGIGVIALSALVPLSTNAQSVDLNARPAEFTAESAIVDTAIPFAIGASEARQSLRGAFGWPTFQEGLVEGVYFRFDPDGYARFSPNPRLDVDVFEVLCKARTKDCHARKAGLTVLLTARGQLQLAVEGVIAGDSFFLSEGVSEIQVPERVLQPLDVQLEHLLSSSLELVVRRGGEEVSRHSLRGFLAATAYLRWIANNQDYAVLPRDWPVPNGRQINDAQRLTQNATWQSPMPQPQVIAITSTPATSAPLQGEADRIEAQLEDLRGMLETLRSTPRPRLTPRSHRHCLHRRSKPPGWSNSCEILLLRCKHCERRTIPIRLQQAFRRHCQRRHLLPVPLRCMKRIRAIAQRISWPTWLKSWGSTLGRR